MSLQQVIQWLPAADDSIASGQALTANTPLSIHSTDRLGNYIDPIYSATNPSFTIGYAAKNVTLTSTDDLSGVNFEIVGLDINYAPLSETLVGPNNATVTSTENYHVVLSITPDSDNAGTVTAGTTDTGVTSWITLDSNRTNSQLALISMVINSGTMTYTVSGTVDRVQYPVNTGPAGGSGIVTPKPFANDIAAFKTKNATVVAQEDLPYAAIQLTVSASTAGDATLTILQPGIE